MAKKDPIDVPSHPAVSVDALSSEIDTKKTIYRVLFVTIPSIIAFALGLVITEMLDMHKTINEVNGKYEVVRTFEARMWALERYNATFYQISQTEIEKLKAEIKALKSKK